MEVLILLGLIVLNGVLLCQKLHWSLPKRTRLQKLADGDKAAGTALRVESEDQLVFYRLSRLALRLSVS